MPLFPPLGGGVRGAGGGEGKSGGTGGVWKSVKVPWKLEAARVKKKVCAAYMQDTAPGDLFFKNPNNGRGCHLYAVYGAAFSGFLPFQICNPFPKGMILCVRRICSGYPLKG